MNLFFLPKLRGISRISGSEGTGRGDPGELVGARVALLRSGQRGVLRAVAAGLIGDPAVPGAKVWWRIFRVTYCTPFVQLC